MSHQLMIGLSKAEIINQLSEQYIEFAHWLYIPALSLLLSFEKQRCMGVQLLNRV